jgi:tetratricopeptide (TPR) repeat protein
MNYSIQTLRVFSALIIGSTLLICYACNNVGSNDWRELLVDGSAYLAAGQLEMAEKYLNKSLVLNPECAETHCKLGRVYELMGKGGRAYIEYRDSVELDSTSVDYLISFVHFCAYSSKEGGREEAIEQLITYAGLDPKRAEFVFMNLQVFFDRDYPLVRQAVAEQLVSSFLDSLGVEETIRAVSKIKEYGAQSFALVTIADKMIDVKKYQIERFLDRAEALYKEPRLYAETSGVIETRDLLFLMINNGLEKISQKRQAEDRYTK